MAQLTQQCILNELQTFWANVLGIDESEVSVRPEDDLRDWIQSLGRGISEELDFADVHDRLVLDFGVEASLDEFGEFLERGISIGEEWEQLDEPTLTIGRFADWIAQHTPVPSYSPVNITGTPCREAGTFLTIKDVVRNVVPRATSIAPSTPILRFLKRRELDRVWCRLRLHSGGRLPQVTWPLERFGERVALTGAAGFCLSLVMGSFDLPWAWFVIGLAISAVLVALGLRFTKSGNPLPSNISTFKDLSMEMTRALSAVKGGS